MCQNTIVMDSLKRGRKSTIVQEHYCIELVKRERGTTLTCERTIVLYWLWKDPNV